DGQRPEGTGTVRGPTTAVVRPDYRGHSRRQTGMEAGRHRRLDLPGDGAGRRGGAAVRGRHVFAAERVVADLCRWDAALAIGSSSRQIILGGRVRNQSRRVAVE